MEKKRSYMYVLEVVTSLVLVGGLFYAGFFVTPTVQVKKIERFPFERRDALYSVATLDDKGNSMCLVGSYGKILRTEDGGKTWQIQKTPTQAHLQKVIAWNKDTLMAIGDNATVLTTRDAGKTWNAVKAPTHEHGDVFLSAFLESKGRVWISGNMGMVLYSDDQGASWQPAHPADDVSWNSVAVAGGEVWLVGEAGKVERSRDLGKSWEKVKVPSEASLNAVTFADDRHGVIVGLNGTILTTANGGKSWEAVDSGVPTHLYGLFWDDKTKSYSAVGDAGMILTADASAAKWQVGKLDPNNFGWYTAIARAGEDFLVSGAGAGLFSKGKWYPFVPDRTDYKNLKGGANG